MDASVVAAVGSFVVSERVLKPKATALFILGCILAYDLTTKTHDESSLRVYRGPALLAVTLMMCAYSLRTWRRNGVACDELLFLPGTVHGRSHGIEGPMVEMPTQPLIDQEPEPQPQSPHRPATTSTREVPDGVNQSEPNNKASKDPTRRLEGDAAGGFASTPRVVRQRRDFAETPTMSAEDVENGDTRSVTGQEGNEETDSLSADESTPERSFHDIAHQGDHSEETCSKTSNGLQFRSAGGESKTTAAPAADDDDDDDGGGGDQQALLGQPTTAVQRFRDNHPRITRIGTFFFFRTSPTATQNAAYAPSGPSVFGAGLDLSMPVLFNFHLFIEAYNHIQTQGSDAPAKILPIIFLSVLIVRTFVPPSRRGRFWSTLKFTFAAPFHRVRFRDEYIGEVLTSLVRPGQDILFALSYYVTVIFGTVSGRYGLTESGHLLQESWLLHNVILPSAAIMPLWWKYLQTLRQAYDSNRRWPFQGNSMKYLSATLVIIYGMTHPEDRRSPWWVVCFFIALTYQIWWDIVMDWDLFELKPRDPQLSVPEQESWCAHISSLRPSSYTLLSLQLYVLQPLLDACQRIRATIPSWRQIQLRPKRLYKTDSFYWKICIVNALLRFTWMVCFIPAYHFVVSKADGQTQEQKAITSSSDVNSYWGVLLPLAEIFRRTLWGFLRLEKETIKMMDSDVMYSRVETDDSDSDEGESFRDDDSSKGGVRSSFRQQLLPTWLDTQQQVAHEAATSHSKQRDVVMRQLFVAEIYIWGAAFVVLGCWAAS